MKSYIAAELLYDKTLVERPDPETGAVRLLEYGYVAAGDPIELDDARAEILLACGAVVPAPDAAPDPAPDSPPAEPAAPRRTRSH